MIDLYNGETNQLIGSITEAGFEGARRAPRGGSAEDQDYYIDQTTIDFMGDGRRRAPAAAAPRGCRVERGMEIRWQRR